VSFSPEESLDQVIMTSLSARNVGALHLSLTRDPLSAMKTLEVSGCSVITGVINSEINRDGSRKNGFMLSPNMRKMLKGFQVLFSVWNRRRHDVSPHFLENMLLSRTRSPR